MILRLLHWLAGPPRLKADSISDECRHPTFDLIATLKCRRLKWARQELTLHTQQGERPTARGLIFDANRMLAAGGYKKGFVLCDAPAHRTVDHGGAAGDELGGLERVHKQAGHKKEGCWKENERC